MVVRTFLAQKLDTIAILNCLGAKSRTIFLIYLLQSLILGCLGCGLGLGLGYALQYFLPERLEGLLNILIKPRFYLTPAIKALILGLLTTILFSSWPLSRAVKTRPLRLFRHLVEEETLIMQSSRTRWVTTVILVSALQWGNCFLGLCGNNPETFVQ